MRWDTEQRFRLWAWRIIAAAQLAFITLSVVCGMASLALGQWRGALVCFVAALMYAGIAAMHRRFWRIFVR